VYKGKDQMEMPALMTHTPFGSAAFALAVASVLGAQSTRRLIERLGVPRPEVKRMLDRLFAVPVDIEPRFLTAEQLERES
jgi:hypothetical protein